MKKRIILERGEIDHIAVLCNCSRRSVIRAIMFENNSDLSKRIRVTAIRNGGMLITP